MAKRLNYEIGFKADTTQLKKDVQSVLSTLQTLSSRKVDLGIDDSIREGARAALELQQHLENAFNVDTGKINLSTLTKTFKESGISLQDYALKLQRLGPEGEQAFLQVAQAIVQAETPLRTTNKMMQELWVTMKNTMRWQITSSALHGFIGRLETAYGYAQDLNESLNNIRIVTSKNTDDMKEFAKQANEAAKALNTTTVEYTDASLIYYQQGDTDDIVEEKTRITIEAANAAGTSAAQMSEYLTAVWNSYQAGAEALESFVDKMAAVGAATASSLEEISTAMTKVASTANTVGVDMDQLTSIIATVASVTRVSPETVGTAYKTIFARIGDLKVGETLDDGTSLGAVSNTLAKADVDILNMNGDLRDMGEVVEEIGDKWQVWNTAQKTAVAQAIAGKRQYTQLIALFDNWDMYRSTLDISRTSEGTLQEQAEIYGEGWEAARDRVSAAAEGIYDSLINDEFFIGLDNVLTPTLGLIEDLIDGMGGFAGVASATGALFTKVYGNQLSESLRNTAQWIRTVTKEEEKRNQVTRNQALQATNVFFGGDGASKFEVQYLKQRNEIQNQLNQKNKNLTEEQRRQLEFELQIADVMKQQVVELNKETEAIDKQIQKTIKKQTNSILLSQYEEPEDKYKSAMIYAYQKSVNPEIKDYTEEKALQIIGNLYAKQAAEQGKVLTKTEQISKAEGYIAVQRQKSLNQIVELGQKASIILGVIKQYKETLNRINQMTDENIDKQELINKLNQSTKNILKQTEFSQGLGSGFWSTQDPEKLLEKMINAGTVYANQQKAIIKNENIQLDVAETLIDLGLEKGLLTARELTATDQVNQQLDNTTKIINANNKATKDWADITVDISNNLFNISMMYNSLTSIKDILTDENASASDIIGGLMSSLPTIAFAISSLGKDLKESATQGGLLGKAITKAGGATTLLGKGLTALGGPLGVIAGLVASIGVKFAFEKIYDYINRYEIAIEEANSALQTQTELYDTLNKKYSDLLTNIADYKDGKNALFELTKGTQEWKEEVEALNQQVLSLIEKYPSLRFTIDDNGIYQIAEEDLEKIEQEQANIRTNALIAQYQAQNEVNNKEIEKVQKEIQDSTKSLLTNYFGSSRNKEYFKDFEDTSISSLISDENLNKTINKLLETRSVILEEENNLFKQFEVAMINNIEAMDDSIELKKKENKLRQDEINRLTYSTYNNETYDTSEDQNLITFALNNRNEGKIEEAKKQLPKDLKTLGESYLNQFLGEGYTFDSGNSSRLEDKMIFIDEAGNKIIKTVTDVENALAQKAIYTDETFAAEVNDINNSISKLSPLSKKIANQYTIDTEAALDELNKLPENIQTKIIDELEKSNLGFKGISNLDSNYIPTREAYIQAQGQKQNTSFINAIQSLTDEDFTVAAGLNLADFNTLNEYLAEVYRIQAENNRNNLTQLDSIINKIKEAEELTVAEQNIVNEIAGVANSTLVLAKSGNEEILDLLEAQREEYERQQKRAKAINQIEFITKLDEKGIDSLEKQLHQELLDNEWEILLTVDTDIQSDLNDIENAFSALNRLNDILSDGLVVTNAEYDELNNLFPKILSNATVTADGMYQLNQEQVEAIRTNKEEYLTAEIDKVKASIQTQIDLENLTIAELENQKSIIDQMLKGEIDFADGKEQLNQAVNRQKAVEQAKAAVQAGDINASELDNYIKNLDQRAQADSQYYTKLNAMHMAMANRNFKEAYSLAQELYGINSGISGINTVTSSTTGVDLATYDIDTINGLLGAIDDDDSNKQLIQDILKVQSDNYQAEIDIRKNKVAEWENDLTKLDNRLKLINTRNPQDSKRSAKQEAQLKELEEIADRYHIITREIEYQEQLLGEIEEQINRTYGGAKLDGYKKQLESINRLIELEREKLKEAEGYLNLDKNILNSLGINAIYDPNSLNISNYDEIMKQHDDKANYYNSLSAAEQEAREKEIEEFEAYWEKVQTALDNYEDSVDKLREQEEKVNKELRERENVILEDIAYEIELHIDVKEAKQELRDFMISIQESYGDYLDHGLNILNLNTEEVKDEMQMIEDYRNQYNSLMAELRNNNSNTEEIKQQLDSVRSGLISSGEALLDYIEMLEEQLPDALSAVRDRFEQFTNILDHNTNVLDSISSLLELQGVLMKTSDGFNKYQNILNESLEASLANATLQSQMYQEIRQRLIETENKLNQATEGTELYEILRKQRDALLEEYQTYQNDMLAAAQATLQAAQEMYLNSISKAAQEFENILTRDLGFDLLQMQYDNFIDENDRYLDEINRIYETTALNNKVQSALDSSTSLYATQRLKALQEEFDLIQSRNKLSEYDIEIMNAKYELTMRQIALEEAQNAKTNLRLTRDASGNWTYQYGADQAAIDEAQSAVDDAQNEWYNIAKDQVTEVTGEIINTWKEMKDAIEETYSDLELTTEEREAKIAEIREYYSQKILDLENMKQIAIKDMTEAGSLVIDDFANNYGENLDNMTQNVENFDSIFNDCINSMEEASQNYQDVITEVNEQVGITYEDLANQLDDVSTSTDLAKEAGEAFAESAWNNIDKIMGEVDAISALIDKMREYLNIVSNISGNINSGLEGMVNNYQQDIAAAMAQYILSGGSVNDATFAALATARNNKAAASGQETSSLDEYKSQYSNASMDALLRWANNITQEDYQKLLQSIGAFNTGGYTGSFDGAKLAFLHQKELVLNPSDTENILNAVNAIRAIEPNILNNIIQSLNNNMLANRMLMQSGLYSSYFNGLSNDKIVQQVVSIQADFPGVNSAIEIQTALENIVNEAAQYANSK